MCVQDIESPTAQYTTYGGNALDEIDRTIHQRGVYRKTLFTQTLSQHGVRLANGFQVMPALSHRQHHAVDILFLRSEERRVGKEFVSTCRSGWSPGHSTKKIRSNKI